MNFVGGIINMVRKIKGANKSAGGSQQDIIRQAQVMQQEMLKIQEGLKDKFVESSVRCV